MFAATLALSLALPTGPKEFNFKSVQPQVFDRERNRVPDIWVLDFTYRKPRYIMVDIPGKGRKLIWYMTYRVMNRTGEERPFIPEFTLVDDEGNSYRDKVLPSAQRAVIAREDPTRSKGLLNSVTISKPIPATPEEGEPIVRYGVAFWEDVDLKTKSFDIFVTGLSNGYVRVDEPDAEETILRRKTLRLRFFKRGDQFQVSEKEIEHAEDPEWIYR